MNTFRLLSKMTWLQTLASLFFSMVPGPILHNLGKYLALKKAFYLVSLDEVSGDYLEFGVFTGSSFCHAVRLAKSYKLYEEPYSMHLFGFDSFGEGFGDLAETDMHGFYTADNFQSAFDDVEARVNRTAGGKVSASLVKGFFEDSLENGLEPYSQNNVAIVFIDSDTFSSALTALNAIESRLQLGTMILMDDFFSYNGVGHLGVSGAFEKFKKEKGVVTRRVFDYGMGGVCHVVSHLSNNNE